MGASWFALKGIPDQGGGSFGVWGALGEGPMVVGGWPHPLATQAKALVSGIYLHSTIETS